MILDHPIWVQILAAEPNMCGLGKCKICGDISYECTAHLGRVVCGCGNDLKGIIKDISKERKKEFIKKVKSSKKWDFIKMHGFP